MGCSECGFEVATDFAFCPKCGSKLSRACPSCGLTWTPEFAFCPKCGARLGGSPPAPSLPAADQRLARLQDLMPAEFAEQLRVAAEAGAASGERRPVTILFADLSGFTALSETLDPEDLAALVDRCLGAMADAIYRYQGTVDKYIGDCVMALFGAPVAHEDDPERAIRAALEMRDQIAAIATQGANPLSLHVGINTGVVVAGAVGSDRRREYT